nr:flagellar hook protein [Treponemataceae bacterium]
MADISIPGVTDKYKTNDLVKSLVEVEKLPLKREQEKLEDFKVEQTNWRRVNQYMSSLRESARRLYSFDNPFIERTATSSDELAITANPDRDAPLDSFKIDVLQTASADRFLSKKIDKNQHIPEGTYKFTVGDKT